MLPFVAGLSAGVLLCVLAWLGGWVPAPSGTGSTGDATAAGAVPPPGIRFEFPDMLRDAEVLVPYVEEYLQPEAAPEQNVDYMLQAGAFRNAQDADRRRAAILLLDLNARTLRVTRQGESWNRVLVGPFANRNRVRDAQLRLLEEDIDSIVLKTARDTDG
ncbi:MAG TPA: SPOR domain-containing protein [Pseudomonadales bacterium]|nr:SPOR domain-containing protein [Pseudomonadales bacterium]